MNEETVLKDRAQVQIITPYRQLRKQRKLTLWEAADLFDISMRTLSDIELGKSDAPKSVVRMMDKEFGCNGALIEYWLTKFSGTQDKKKRLQNCWEQFQSRLVYLLNYYITF